MMCAMLVRRRLLSALMVVLLIAPLLAGALPGPLAAKAQSPSTYGGSLSQTRSPAGPGAFAYLPLALILNDLTDAYLIINGFFWTNALAVTATALTLAIFSSAFTRSRAGAALRRNWGIPFLVEFAGFLSARGRILLARDDDSGQLFLLMRLHNAVGFSGGRRLGRLEEGRKAPSGSGVELGKEDAG